MTADEGRRQGEVCEAQAGRGSGALLWAVLIEGRFYGRYVEGITG